MNHTASSIGIIGGADGPTAVFVTGADPFLPTVAAAVLAAGIIGFFIWKNHRKK